MLETCLNQAAGLQALALQTTSRLIAVTSHGQQQGELPLLWSLCSAWVELGLPVAVLDGQTRESPQNPGLMQLLDDPQSHLTYAQEPVSWSVVPATLGFERLSGYEFPNEVLGNLFANYDVVLIYASASTITKLLKNSAASPLLLVAPLATSSLSAYQAIKQLLLDAKLRPTVANIALTSHAQAAMTTSSPVQHLQNCAMTFLSYRLDPIPIRAAVTDDRSQDDINRLALQLLENAVPLQRHHAVRGR